MLPAGRVENEENLALELGCKIGSLSAEYFGGGGGGGVPLGAKHKAASVWDGVEERFHKRLAN